jgi:hypothetical protein
MKNNTTARSLAHALLARRKKATALRLRLAERKAEAQEAVYGFASALPLRIAVADLRERLARLTA